MKYQLMQDMYEVSGDQDNYFTTKKKRMVRKISRNQLREDLHFSLTNFGEELYGRSISKRQMFNSPFIDFFK